MELALDRGPGWPAPLQLLQLLRPGRLRSAPPRLPFELAALRPGWLRSGSIQNHFKTIQNHFTAPAPASPPPAAPALAGPAPALAGSGSSGPGSGSSFSGSAPPWLRLAGPGWLWHRLRSFPRPAPAPPAPIISPASGSSGPGWPFLLSRARK